MPFNHENSSPAFSAPYYPLAKASVCFFGQAVDIVIVKTVQQAL
jgi:hypothetical protein